MPSSMISSTCSMPDRMICTRMVWVRALPLSTLALKLGGQLATATNFPSASSRPISRIQKPPMDIGSTSSATSTFALCSETNRRFS